MEIIISTKCPGIPAGIWIIPDGLGENIVLFVSHIFDRKAIVQNCEILHYELVLAFLFFPRMLKMETHNDESCVYVQRLLAAQSEAEYRP